MAPDVDASRGFWVENESAEKSSDPVRINFFFPGGTGGQGLEGVPATPMGGVSGSGVGVLVGSRAVEPCVTRCAARVVVPRV